MIALALFLATCFLAYSNGANDNFKGVASLFGCKAASYRAAITWATITTFAGSIAAIFLAQALLKKFSGKGLVPGRDRRFPAVSARRRDRSGAHRHPGDAPRVSDFHDPWSDGRDYRQRTGRGWRRGEFFGARQRVRSPAPPQSVLAMSLGGLLYFVFRRHAARARHHKGMVYLCRLRRAGRRAAAANFDPHDAVAAVGRQPDGG